MFRYAIAYLIVGVPMGLLALFFASPYGVFRTLLLCLAVVAAQVAVLIVGDMVKDRR